MSTVFLCKIIFPSVSKKKKKDGGGRELFLVGNIINYAANVSYIFPYSAQFCIFKFPT